MSLSLQAEHFQSFAPLAAVAAACQWSMAALGPAGAEPSMTIHSTDDSAVREALRALSQCNDADTFAVADVAGSALPRHVRQICQDAGVGAYFERRKSVALAGGSVVVAVAVAHSGPVADGAHVCRVIDLLADQMGDSARLARQVRGQSRGAAGAPAADEADGALFRMLFESAPALYLVLSTPPYRILAASDAYLATVALRREDVVGTMLFDTFPDDPCDPRASGVAAMSASLARVQQTRAPDAMAIQRYPIRQGDDFVLKYWSVVNFPVFDADQAVSVIINRVEDVTDYVLARREEGIVGHSLPLHAVAKQETEIVLRSLEMKRLAESLSESEQRLQFVIRATGAVVWDWHMRDDSLWCSQGGDTGFGARFAGFETLAQWSAEIHPRDRVRVLASLHASVAAGNDQWSAEYCVGEGGDAIEVLHHAFFVKGDRGGPVRAVGSMTDNSERKRDEARLRLQAEMLDNANDAILVRDLQHRILYWNRAAEVRYGWPAHEVIGRLATDTVYANSPGHEFDNAMQTLFRTGDFNGRMVHSRRDGSRFVVHAHWILVRNADATPRAILSVVTDLTDQIALEQRLQQAQKLESLGQITGGIAHDFNNWLTVIIGNAEELAESLSDRPDLADLAGMIQTAGERGAGLTRRLLAFARQQPLEPEPLDVSALIGGMQALIRRSIGKNIDLRVKASAHVWYVSVDRAQLENAILNLCINASDAMPGGGTLTIAVGNEHASRAGANRELAPADLVVISVSDTGCGVPEDLQDRIFEPFFTTKKAGSGGGLGLSMAYGFARQSDGNLTLQSEPGAGATFSLYLPRSYAEPDDAAAVAGATGNAGSATVLMVEDDPLVHVVTSHQLKALGYAVVQASSGAEALDVLERGVACDVLFTDVIMPGMTGVELAERALALRPGLPVLLTSGYTYAATLHKGRLDPRFPLLHKPYARSALAAALDDALNTGGRVTAAPRHGHQRNTEAD